MEIEDFIITKRELQSLILDYIEDIDLGFERLSTFIQNSSILKNKGELKDILYMVLYIANNHHREPDFFEKINKILTFIFNIQTFFTYIDFFSIFSDNKLIVLRLIQNKLIKFTKDLMQIISEHDQNKTDKLSYFHFLYPALKNYFDENEQKRIENEISQNYNIDYKTFEQNCYKGENDSYICDLIRQDSIKDFIVYVNQNNISPNSKIKKSIFETNEFLKNKNPTLIEYATFYGSIQIFKYLQMNNAELTSSLWEYAIHSGKAELIHQIEENHIKTRKNNLYPLVQSNSYDYLLDESIKCHHNDIARYIKENYLIGYDDKDELQTSIKYLNYTFLPTDYKKLLSVPNINRVFSSIMKITIPSSETKIDDSLFRDFESLEQIIIPKSVTLIGSFVFYNCSSLSKISIPSSVIKIGKGSFCGCKSLTKISIPSSVNKIGKEIFNNCTSLVQISLPSSIKKIGKGTFSDCKSLKQITIPPSIALIGDHSFSRCSSLINITIPSSVTSIGSFSFSSCSSLKEITIPSSVTSIEKGTFYDCSSLIKVSIPSSITLIGNSSFCGCSSLEQISIPSSVTLIEECAFASCSSLMQITIPSSVTRIENGTFYGCISLTKVSIPSSVKSIGECAFGECSSLKEISIPSSTISIDNSAFNGCSELIQEAISVSKI